jgi:hypothetical protein
LHRDTVRLLQARAMSEEELEGDIAEACAKIGLFYFHVPDSRWMEAGLPDDLIVGERGYLFNENKRQRERPTLRQADVLARLQRAGAPVRITRPLDWLDGTMPNLLREIA